METTKLTLKGRVQGVGMRFTVSRLAKQHNLSGYVKNKADGGVECLVQGEEDIIERFIEQVKTRTPGYIDKLTIERVEYAKHYDSFQIRLF